MRRQAEAMTHSSARKSAARRVELVFGETKEIAALPGPVGRALRCTEHLPGSTDRLAKVVQAEPALALRILQAAYERGSTGSAAGVSLHQSLAELPKDVLQRALLGIKVFGSGRSQGGDEFKLRQELVAHSVGVALCAREIGSLVMPRMESEIFYLAGLLHDIGKLAVQQVMPRSLRRVITSAQSQQGGICEAEQEHLGLDHALIGKRLAEQWRLPEEITCAIWLHHAPSTSGVVEIEHMTVAGVVQLADAVVRRRQIGFSGSFDGVEEKIDALARTLSVEKGLLREIEARLESQVEGVVAAVGLSEPAAAGYCEALQKTAVSLAAVTENLGKDNGRLAVGSTHFDFITELLAGAQPAVGAIATAGRLAALWRRFYRTGPVCVFLSGPGDNKCVQAVVADGSRESRTYVIDRPANASDIVNRVEGFGIHDAYERAGWLLERLDSDFDPGRTKVLPLQTGREGADGMIFELGYKAADTQQQRSFSAGALVAAAVMGLALAAEQQRHRSEEFAELLGRLERDEKAVADARLLLGIAEMAAGAGHELNTPLAVISGRAQLLEQQEADPEKKRILQQIRVRSEEVSRIVSDLMAFARPSAPSPAAVEPGSLLAAAAAYITRTGGREQLELRMRGLDCLPPIYVDTGQVTAAVTNILRNAAESYKTGYGPVEVVGQRLKGEDAVSLAIHDYGRGMEPEVLAKAMQPFFSYRPAGRKRGMGLAQAQRLIRLNGGRISVASQPGQGTTVTVVLPCAESENRS